MKGRIIVTGGAGFIGSAIVHELNKNGYDDIIIVDDLDKLDDKWKNIANLQFTELMDKKFLADHSDLGSIAAIFHMGASSGTDIKMTEAITNNYYYTMELLTKYARTTKIVLASSDSVYGNYSGQAREGDRMSPLNPYAFSKSLVDKWMPKMVMSHSNAVSLRFSNVFGPNEYHKAGMMSIVTKIIGDMREGKTVELFEGSDAMRRDFIYVEDVAQIAVKMLDANVWYKGPSKCGIFNVGTNTSTSFLDIVTMAMKVVNGRDIEDGDIQYVPMPKHLAYGYQHHTLMSNTKVVAATRHEMRTVESAVTDYIDQFYSTTIKKNLGEADYGK